MSDYGSSNDSVYSCSDFEPESPKPAKRSNVNKKEYNCLPDHVYFQGCIIWNYSHDKLYHKFSPYSKKVVKTNLKSKR